MNPDRQIEYLQLVTRHQAAIYAYIRSIAPGSNADDILQETNIVLWEKSSGFVPGTNFKAFAFRIAHFKTLEALRAEKRRHWLVFDSDLLEALAAHQHLQVEGHDPSHARQSALRHCLARLSDDDRSLIHSRYTRCQSLKDLASTTGRSVGALQQVFFRIRNALRTCIEQNTEPTGGQA